MVIILSDKKKEIVKDLYINKKYTVKQIVEFLNNPNITKSSIDHLIQRNGWTRKTVAPNLTQEEKDFILVKFNEGLNCSEIGKLLGYSHKRINAFIRRQGLHSSAKKKDKLTGDEIEDIKTMYDNKCTGKEILKKYRDKISCDKTIIRIAKEEGCIIRPRGQIPRSLNEDFFKTIDTEEKAYFLGWMLSDGYVIKPSNKKTYPIGIDVKIGDKYILEKFKEAIKLDESAPLLDQVKKAKINSSKNARKKDTYQTRLLFYSKKMTQDLKKYNVIPRKSHTVRFPENIDSNMIHHVIRGIFDGDGCISHNLVSFYGNEYMMKDIKKILVDTININDNKIFNGETCFSFSFSSKKDVKNFYHYIYDDATIFLKRKKERFEKLDYIKQKTQ